jgi:hypothetical protein
MRKILDAADMLPAHEARAAVAATMAIELKEMRRLKGGQLAAALLSAGVVAPAPEPKPIPVHPSKRP